MATEARDEGKRELASSLRKLRKPSVGAWLANLLVFEQRSDVEQLVQLGAELRSPRRKVDGDQIRKVSKEKGGTVSKLIRDARSIASREGQSISEAASLELEATLEAAFADPQAAKSLLGGRLCSGLHYSGLGFGEPAVAGSNSGPTNPASAQRAKSADKIAAKSNLAKARQDAERADSQLEKASQAVAHAADKLTQLASAETQAAQRSKEAHARASAAQQKLDKLP